MSGSTALQTREYKLLLDPDRFGGEMSLKEANRFWNDEIKPILDRELRPRKDFDRALRRLIRFRDTRNHRLDGSDYILRDRIDIDEQGNTAPDRKLTLKLRTTDLFVAAGTALQEKQRGAKPDFEEDIAPLQISVTLPSRSRIIAVADPRTIRSRFSVSTDRSVPENTTLDRLGDALELYPTLLDNLMLTCTDEIRSDEALLSGPEISELVFKDAQVDLGDDVTAEFSLTLWYFGSRSTTPRVAEISFKCKVKEGHVPRGAAARALKLFVGMQDDLGDWVNFEEQSKTALALPPRN